MEKICQHLTQAESMIISEIRSGDWDILQITKDKDRNWKKRSKNQSPADPPESPLPIRFLNGRQNLLTTKTSVNMGLSRNFYQVLYDLIGDWSTSGAAD